MDLNQKLSKNFTLNELLRSPKADQLSIKEQYEPSEVIVEQLKLLAEHVLQPLRDGVGKPLRISSGYRCPRLNEKVGGKPNSQHMKGQAADIDMGDKKQNQMLYDYIKEHLDYDQLIWEYGGSWVHVSFHEGHNRKQAFDIT